jgi:transketolase C-terminal domain/subunit
LAVSEIEGRPGARTAAIGPAFVGGLGSAVSEIVAEIGVGRVRRVGIPDRFVTEIAPHAELVSLCGLDAAGVEAAARELVSSP